MRSPTLVALLACLISLPALGQQSSLEQQNKDLRDYAARLEDRVRELEGKLKEFQKRPLTLVIPRGPAPYGFELPAQPFGDDRFKMPNAAKRAPQGPTTRPFPELRPPLAPIDPKQIPPTWGKGQINGMEFYVVPLR